MFKDGWLHAVACCRVKGKPHTAGDQAIVMAGHFNRAAFNRGERELAFPGIDMMARKLGVHRSTVMANNAWFEANGFLEIRRRRVGKRNLANLYAPIIPRQVAKVAPRRSSLADWTGCFKLARELFGNGYGPTMIGAAQAKHAPPSLVMEALQNYEANGGEVGDFAAEIGNIILRNT